MKTSVTKITTYRDTIYPTVLKIYISYMLDNNNAVFNILH